MLRTVLYAIVFFCFVFAAKAQTQQAEVPDSSKFELSFGRTQLFISDSKSASIKSVISTAIPTNALLLFLELRPAKKLRIPVFVNIPTEPKQYLVNNQLKSELASPSFGAGVQYRCFNLKIDKRSRLEGELGPMLSAIPSGSKQILIAPFAAGRLRLVRSNSFVMYLGSSYTFGINVFGLLYGTGFLF